VQLVLRRHLRCTALAYEALRISSAIAQSLMHQTLQPVAADFPSAWHSLCISDARADKMLKPAASPIYSPLGELS
jgi:hypothetical protein